MTKVEMAALDKEIAVLEEKVAQAHSTYDDLVELDPRNRGVCIDRGSCHVYDHETDQCDAALR